MSIKQLPFYTIDFKTFQVLKLKANPNSVYFAKNEKSHQWLFRRWWLLPRRCSCRGTFWWPTLELKQNRRVGQSSESPWLSCADCWCSDKRKKIYRTLKLENIFIIFILVFNGTLEILIDAWLNKFMVAGLICFLCLHSFLITDQ